ncbi:MAG: type I restriction enzyme HsdR N-terminal domain-containing protein [Bacteroidales bacterium]
MKILESLKNSMCNDKKIKIFDPLRKKEVVLTPEEKVRQSIICWLHSEAKVPMGLMMSEFAFKFNGLDYRADIVIFDRNVNPIMLVECKAPSVKIDNYVIEQGIRYNRVLKVPYMMFVNGEKCYICKYIEEEQDKNSKKENKKAHFEFLSKLPSYSELIKKPKNAVK